MKWFFLLPMNHLVLLMPCFALARRPTHGGFINTDLMRCVREKRSRAYLRHSISCNPQARFPTLKCCSKSRQHYMHVLYTMHTHTEAHTGFGSDKSISKCCRPLCSWDEGDSLGCWLHRNPTETIKLLTRVIKDLFWLPVWRDGRKQTSGPDGRNTHLCSIHTHLEQPYTFPTEGRPVW